MYLMEKKSNLLLHPIKPCVPEEGSQAVSDWLNGLRLDQYCVAFLEAGFETLWNCQELTSAKLEGMGVLLPGHRKRMISSLRKIFHSHIELETDEDDDRYEDKPIPKERTKNRGRTVENPVLPLKHPPPPVPPRCSVNRPPLPFTSTGVSLESNKQLVPTERANQRPVPKPRPKDLSLTEPVVPNRKQPPVSPVVSSSSSTECFHLYEQCSSPAQGDTGAPPLPPKSYAVALPKEPKESGCPPVPPPRVSVFSKSMHSSISTTADTNSCVSDDPADSHPAPDLPARSSKPAQLSSKSRFHHLHSEEISDDFEGGERGRESKLIDMASKMSLMVPKETKTRCSSICSDDELLDDDANGYDPNSVYLPGKGLVCGSLPQDDLISTSAAVIKMGWLDKNPPQGSLIYQRRWDVYSKRIIPTASITTVLNVGDQKFEVVTHNRVFLFRAESDVERREWVTALKSCMSSPMLGVTSDPSVTAEMKGYLELRGLRSKLYTVVCGDKVFLFIADSDQLRDQWIESMHHSIAESLSNYEVAERIWEEPSNQMCADCSAGKPEWASVNLAVVFCKRCAGEHRSLGPNISKVRSLKMDRKVWTEELIQLFLSIGNERANQFWAANVPPSEELTLNSSSEERRRFITAKYREGKYRRYHPLFGNQRELNNALCINVQSSDVCETLALIFCGADVSCESGDPALPTPIALASHYSQLVQLEMLQQNRNTEIPRSEIKVSIDTVHYMAPPSITHNGFLFKTASMARPITERKGKEDSERLYLFGSDHPDTTRDWVKSIAKSFIPAAAEDLLLKDFERIGRLRFKDRLNREIWRLGWFCLAGSSLFMLEENRPPSSSQESIDLQKLLELSIQPDNEVLVLVERGRTLYLAGERKLDFQGWFWAIQRAAGRSGDSLSQQQLTEGDIPIATLQESFRCDARSMWLKEAEHQVDDVSNVLKRFFRDIEEGLFGSEAHAWLAATGISDESSRLSQYRLLFSNLPRCFSDLNHMTLHNLAIVFGPTLFQADGKDYSAGRVVEELIQHYITIFTGSGDFICTVYLEERKETAEQHVKIPATMTAAELTFEILDRRKITVKEKDYWSCFEVHEREEMERPLHYQERVLPIFQSLGTDCHLLVKKFFSMEAMLIYLASKVEVSRHGMLRFREERSSSILSLNTNFNDRYFILTESSLRLYKEIRSNRPEREWPVKCLKVYLGIKKKQRPPTWYLCCDTQNEMREWFATFMSIQNGGRVWPAEWLKTRAVSRSAPADARLGNVSLIPLRGTENEMRSSVATSEAVSGSVLASPYEDTEVMLCILGITLILTAFGRKLWSSQNFSNLTTALACQSVNQTSINHKCRTQPVDEKNRTIHLHKKRKDAECDSDRREISDLVYYV
ncbi:hypothetical protein DNTS_006329 [Danionella cerebrum]|uniref:Arf-GAP with Rho-GAP domain, ANK repeat and PH domain-containing protein 1 n=1 Tax=Danionella cerebrum TaxID=2873325 RepID=A0A553Q5C6_9TELE|nr:hypothetical protein DNTS_006329 [Danionella translucida]TRY85125.1 hypothetical protein DNTS_006329 [Danionella translucida]